ncbi:MAG: Pyrroline-5-carboxylate reductase [Lentisphaerae bacterium ADurb.BinA184]|nr:MAG: Pyrroline-5-carboxylate reductase [Lentisphaerae bacterium ADurb.BinA184]
MKIGFLGAGKMATALAKGLVDKGVCAPADLLAADVAAAARQAFTEATGVACSADAAAMARAVDVLVVAVKPQVAAAAVAGLREFCGGRLVVSIAAGIPLVRLAAWVGHDRLVRVMPNTPVVVGMGASVFAAAAGVDEADRRLVGRMFGAVGLALEMPEERLDAVTALSGSGPAYAFEMIRALTAGAVALGLPPEAALQLAAQTLAGAAEMVRRGLGTPEQLRVAVTSPGGTTAAGLAVLDRAGFPALVAEVLRAARDRSVELGRCAG